MARVRAYLTLTSPTAWHHDSNVDSRLFDDLDEKKKKVEDDPNHINIKIYNNGKDMPAVAKEAWAGGDKYIFCAICDVLYSLSVKYIKPCTETRVHFLSSWFTNYGVDISNKTKF